MALFASTIGATVTMHDYWNLATLAARTADFDIFARNVAIAGGLLVLMGVGPGRFAAGPRWDPVADGEKAAAGAEN